MEHIAPGDQVLAVANISGEYELVAIFQVTAVGENHPSDPDYHEYGQFFFEADPSISRYTDPARRISADSAIRASRLTTNAKILGHSFRGKNGVRRLSNQEAKQIIATAL